MDERTGRRFSDGALEDPAQIAERAQILYDSFPLPTFTWRKDGAEFLLVDFNEAAAGFTQGVASGFIGQRAEEVLGDRSDILDDLNLCYESRSSISREMPYANTGWDGGPWELRVAYVFIPPDMVVVHLETLSTDGR